MNQTIRTLTSLVIIAALVIAGIVFIPRLTHNCDNCGNFFVGTGYYANVVSNALTSITGQQDKILCNDCAAKEHALSIAAGKSLDEFKRPLFNEDN